MVSPGITVQMIANDIYKQLPMIAQAHEEASDQFEKCRLQGRLGGLLTLLRSIDPSRADMFAADWDARTTGDGWADDL